MSLKLTFSDVFYGRMVHNIHMQSNHMKYIYFLQMLRLEFIVIQVPGSEILRVEDSVYVC